MKKFLAIAVIAALMVSCNGDKSAEATTETVDTTAAATVDTAAAAVVDTAAAAATVDTAAAAK